ncbi:MAG: transporter, partial [Polyangiales bacterium]
MRPWRSRRCAELAAALLVLSASREARACPCGAPAGAFPAWTALDERLTLSLVLGAHAEHGSFDEHGRAWPLPARVSMHRLLADLTVAWRPAPAWELAASVSAAWSDARQPGLAAEGVALGDTALRARWEGPRSPRRGVPGAAVWSGVRIPTGDRDPRAQGLTGVGLGHWELSLGGELRWDLAARWSASVGAELGVRAPARWNDVDVTPGPRTAALLL